MYRFATATVVLVRSVKLLFSVKPDGKSRKQTKSSDEPQ